MGRRRNSVAEFFDGFNQAYGVVGKVLSDREMRQISEAKQENMAPVDTVEFKPSPNDGAPDPQAQDPSLSPPVDAGQPAPTAEEVAAPMRGQVVSSLPAQTRFLGKTYDKPLSQGEEGKARMMAMSGVMSKFGDPMGAVRLRAAANGVAADEQRTADDQALRAALTPPEQNPRPQGIAATNPNITGASLAPGQPPTAAMMAQRGIIEPSAPPKPVAPNDAKPGAKRGDDAVNVDRYLKNIASQATLELVRQGRLNDAERFQNFVESQDGRKYAAAWLRGVRQHAVGDDEGALKTFEGMYNDQLYNDGKQVRLVPLNGGKEYRIDMLGDDGAVTNSRAGSTADLTKQAALTLEPTRYVSFLVQQEAARNRESATLERQTEMERLRQQGRQAVEDRRDSRQATRIASSGGAGELTAAQQRTNDSIIAARRSLTGLTGDDVLKRTQATTATGRENPDYDPELSRAVRLANTRLYGDDPAHDAFTAGAAKRNAQRAEPVKGNDVAARFQADPKTKGMRLGNPTPQGMEVLDASGRLVGHYH